MTCEHFHLAPCPYCEIQRLRTALRALSGSAVAQTVLALSTRLEAAELTIETLRASLRAAAYRQHRLAAKVKDRERARPAPVDTMDV